MLKRSLVLSTLLSAALACSLAACGGKDVNSSDLPTRAPEPTGSSSTPPATLSTPTPTGVPTSSVARYADLTLDLRRPATLDAKGQAALSLFMDLNKSFGAMLAGGKQPAELSRTATSDVIADLNYLLEPQRKLHERGGGTVIVQVTDVQTSASAAVVEGCFDQSKLVMIRPSGSRYVDATVKNATVVMRVTVMGRSPDRRISDLSFKGHPC